jgi:hypothetical protein
MKNQHEVNLDDQTIEVIGLIQTNKQINAEIAPSARVFEYPHLEDVYIMECDLYGNIMPKDSCFLAFTGHHGMIGKHIKVEMLKQSSVLEIKQMVEENNEG